MNCVQAGAARTILGLFLTTLAAHALAAPPTLLDEPPPLLLPRQSRTEAEQDHLQALTLFSAARLHEQRQDEAAALRLYQRAFRLDPHSPTIARAIVPLAARLERHAEAVRYALRLVELEDADPELLKRLGIFLTETGKWSEALRLYEKSLAARKAQEGFGEILLHMEMGRLYHLQEKYEQAAGHFARVLDALEHPGPAGLDSRAVKALLGEPGTTYSLIGEVFLRAGQPERASAAFLKSHQATPNKALRAYNLARIDARAGQWEKALDKLDGCFRERLASEGLGPYRLLEEVLRGLHRESELLPRLEKLHAADAANVPLGYFLAEQYLKAGLLEKAGSLYQAMVAKTPTVSGYRSLIEIYRQTRQHEALLAVLGEAASKTVTLEPLADKDQPLGNDAQVVRTLVELARDRWKKQPPSLPYEQRLAVALLSMDAKQFATAREFFNLAIESRPGQAGELLLTWGLGLLLKDQFREAAEVFQRGVAESTAENSAAFYYYLAGALEMCGQSDQALSAARKAAGLALARDSAATPGKDRNPKKDGPRFLARIAWILYHAKRHAEAQKAYAELLDKFAADYSSSETRQVLREARLVLSSLAVVQGDLPHAEEWLEQVLDEFPDDPSALNDLGYLWADEGKHLARAQRMIHSALCEEPDNAAYRDSLGWVLFRRGRVDEAVAELEKAASQEPDAAVLDHLGDAYLAARQPAKAHDAWRRAAEAHRKAGDVDKARRVEKKLNPAK